MNKKIIMLISTLFCGNSMMIASQESLLMQPLTTEESKVYQELTAKFHGKALTTDDDTVSNKTILGKRAAFLSQKIETQEFGEESIASSFSYSLVPALSLHSLMGNPKSSILLYWLVTSLVLNQVKKLYYYPSKKIIKKQQDELRIINDIINNLANLRISAQFERGEIFIVGPNK